MQDRYRAWIRRVLRLYPRAWRDRYQEELLQVLQQFPVSAGTVGDFLLGALDARLHPDLIPGKVIGMTQQLRTSIITVFCAIVLFSLAWAATFQVKDPLPAWEAATLRYPTLLYAFETAQSAGLIVLLALFIGGVPTLLSALRAAWAQHRRVLLLFLIPIAAVVGLVLFAAVALNASTARVAAGNANAQLTPGAFALQLLLLLLLTILVVGSVVAVAVTVARSEPDLRTLRFALLAATIATIAMAVGLAATVMLAGISFADAPQLGPTQLAICAAVMLLALLIALLALRRGMRANKIFHN